MMVVAVRINATISTEQWTVIKVEVPMTTPVAPMDEGLGSISTNLNRRVWSSRIRIGGSCQHFNVPDIQRNEEGKNPKSNALLNE
jgi:hypothetical protein